MVGQEEEEETHGISTQEEPWYFKKTSFGGTKHGDNQHRCWYLIVAAAGVSRLVAGRVGALLLDLRKVGMRLGRRPGMKRRPGRKNGALSKLLAEFFPRCLGFLLGWGEGDG